MARSKKSTGAFGSDFDPAGARPASDLAHIAFDGLLEDLVVHQPLAGHRGDSEMQIFSASSSSLLQTQGGATGLKIRENRQGCSASSLAREPAASTS